jgi:hypothetical protein
MSNFSAFLTGFLGRTADVIKERKDKAENYFDQSIERARTIGSDQLRQRTDNYQAMLSVANNLVQQAGMPEDLVRTLANEGPQALEEAYKVYTETAAREAELGTTILGEDFWRQSYNFATEMTTGTDMSLTDFLRQVNGLYGSNLAATTREGGDPFGAFIASGLGLNAMERAQGRLSEYDMGGGYSAADLLAMDARPSTTRPLGETNFGGLDRSYVHQQLVDDGIKPFTIEEMARIDQRFEEATQAEAERLFREELQRASDSQEPSTATSEQDFMEQARYNVGAKFAELYGPAVYGVRTVAPYLPYIDEEEELDEEGPQDSPLDEGDVFEGGEEGVVEQEPVVDLPDGIIDMPELPQPITQTPLKPTPPEPEINETLVGSDGTVLQLIDIFPDGTLQYRRQDGTAIQMTIEERIEAVTFPDYNIEYRPPADTSESEFGPDFMPSPPNILEYQGDVLSFQGDDGAGNWIYLNSAGEEVRFRKDRPIISE